MYALYFCKALSTESKTQHSSCKIHILYLVKVKNINSRYKKCNES